MMESNKDEALKCLRIAQKHRDAGNFPSARKFCQKSLSLFATPEAEMFKESIESAAAAAAKSAGPSSSTGTSNGDAATASSSSTQTHPSAAGAKHRTDAKTEGTAGGMNGEKREYTAEQVNVVKRVKACKPTSYYEILGLKKDCEEADIKKAYRKVIVLFKSAEGGLLRWTLDSWRLLCIPTKTEHQQPMRLSRVGHPEWFSARIQLNYSTVVSKAFQVLSGIYLIYPIRSCLDTTFRSTKASRL